MFGGWALAIAIGSVIGALTSGLVTYLFQHRHKSRKLRREGYGEAIAALYAWYEYPFQIRRRTSNSPETLDRLVQLGNENQQRIARSLAWIALDNDTSYLQYQKLVEQVKNIVAKYIKGAWKLPPILNSVDINLGSWGPESIDDLVKNFLDNISPIRFKYLKKFVNWRVRVKKGSDDDIDSKDSKVVVEDIKRSGDKYVNWSDMHRMFNDRSIRSIFGLIGTFILGVQILIDHRYTDPNSVEGQNAILLWSMTVTLMSSYILIFASAFLSRRTFKETKIPFRKTINAKNTICGVIIAIFSFIAPLILFYIFRAIID